MNLNRRFIGNKGTTLAWPSGMLGLWLADDYATSPRNHIPNRAASLGTTHLNLLSASRRLFNNTVFFTKVSATVTDANASAADATNDASTVVLGSADAYVRALAGVLPSGTYTLGIDVATTDGSTVNFRMGTSASNATKTATPTWTRFTHTFVLASSSDPIIALVRTVNTSTPANLKIINATLHQGASDLGIPTMDGAMVFGAGAYLNQPTSAGSGILSLNASLKFGLVSLPTRSLTSYTIMAVGAKRGTNPTIHQPYFSKVSANTQFTAMHCNTLDGEGALFGGSLIVNEKGGAWQYKTDDWHWVANRYDGSTQSAWMDGVPSVNITQSGASATVDDFWVGVYNSATSYARYDLHGIAYWPRSLSNAEMNVAWKMFKLRCSNFSLTLGNPRWYCWEGDSITQGNQNGALQQSYARRFPINSSPAVNGRVQAVGGSTLADVYARAGTADAMIPAVKDGRLYVYSLLIGRNDLGAYPGGTAQYAADVRTLTLARKAAGWDRVVLHTVLPASTSGFNTVRNALNAIFNGPGWAAASGIDLIIPFGEDLTMGKDGDDASLTYYLDGTHPNDTGQAYLETVHRSYTNALV